MSEIEVAIQILLEMWMSPIERAFVESLKEDRYDESTRNAYIDFLKEKGRDRTAKMVEEYDHPHYYQYKNLKLPSESSTPTELPSGFVPSQFSSGFMTTVYNPTDSSISGVLQSGWTAINLPSGCLGDHSVQIPHPFQNGYFFPGSGLIGGELGASLYQEYLKKDK